ncbi:MAG: type IX secretion system membrane protein PorP/SprF, partial [Chloroflexi bacterium]
MQLFIFGYPLLRKSKHVIMVWHPTVTKGLQNTKQFILIACLTITMLTVKGQDIHFSQFYFSPLTLNPALTGLSEGDYRIAGIYRNQWASVTTPYVTYSVSYDMRLLKEKLGNDLFGVGGMMFNDKSGDGHLTNLTLMASAAYHKLLGEKHYLALGVQGG